MIDALSDTNKNLDLSDQQNTYQYLNYPYPPRAPEDERRRLIAPMMDCFDVLNHRAFGGKKTFNKDFRVLVAGGGTGDSAIFLAEQLRSAGSIVEYVDLSEVSMQIAQQRAAVRNLTNIQWRAESLLGLRKEDVGEFDYINCSGVLHHLRNPVEGLIKLKSLLKPGGVIGVMLYGQLAREGVYQLQTLLSLLNKNASGLGEELEVAQKLMGVLPETNLFQRTARTFSDHQRGDAGIVDLLLHKNDRAYTVTQLYDFVSQAEMAVSGFVEPHLYRLDYYSNRLDEEIVERFKSLSKVERQQAVELFCGDIKTHAFYASKEPVAPPSITCSSNIPSLPISSSSSLHLQLSDLVFKNLGAEKAGFRHEGRSVNFRASKLLGQALRYLDGKHTLSAIYSAVSKESKVPEEKVEHVFLGFYKSLARYGLIFLRANNIPGYQFVEELANNKNVR